MTLELWAEIANGLSVEEYLKELVERELPATQPAAQTLFDAGLGLFGSPEDSALLDEVVAIAYSERRRPSEPPSIL